MVKPTKLRRSGNHVIDPLRSLQIGPSFPFAAWGLAMPDTITLELSKDEALVLFEWLYRREDARRADKNARKDDPDKAPLDAEEIVLSGVLCLLEKELVEPFNPNYDDLVAAARLRILGDTE
jgi:hypothetical protein